MNTEPITSKQRISELEIQIKEANKHYRTGDATISDQQYDLLVDELEKLDPNNELLNEIGLKLEGERMQDLPVPMASMNKIKTFEQFKKWLKSKDIPSDAILVCTAKFDGLSFCVDERINDAWSRGDGKQGQYSADHYKLIKGRAENVTAPANFYSIGEVIMPRQVFEVNKFLKDDGTPFKNPRNLVAGKINDDVPNEILKHCVFIRYGMFHLDGTSYKHNKTEQLDSLNKINPIKVDYKTFKASEITEDILISLFHEWNTTFEIDGLIIEVNDHNLREELGRETSTGNPCFARAFKHESFEDVAPTPVIGLNGQMTKQGFLAPVIQVEPVLLNGATVSNVFADNAKYVVENGIGIGAIVKIKRSGMVIPRIVEVIKKADQTYLPTNCPSCNGDLTWNETKVQLCCTNDDCPAQRLQKIVAFFEILEVDNMGEGVCEQLYDAGYDTVAKILNMSKEDMKALDRFGDRKADIVYGNIKKAITDVPLSKLQHATGCFKGLGSTKLELVTWADETTPLSSLCEVEGFSDISAKNFKEGIVKFNKMMEELNGFITVKIQKDKPQISGDKCKDWVVVFTGFTNEEMEKFIVENGGKIGSGVNKKTTHLVMKVKGSGSSKEQKAQELNIPIFDADEFKNLIS